jgi:tetratricopeptide (TPR) repeat protein
VDTSPSIRADEPARALRMLLAAHRFDEALDLYRDPENIGLRERPEATYLAATAAVRLGRDGLGEELANDAHLRFHARADEDGRMRTANLLGAIEWKRGHLRDAERHFGEALQLAQRLDDGVLSARAANNLGLVAHLQGETTASLRLFRTALLSFQRLGDRRGTAETYHNLGLAFRQLQEWTEAENAVLQASRHAELLGDRSLNALVTIGRAELDLDRGELEVADATLDRAAQLARDAKDEVLKADTRRLRALLGLRRATIETAYADAEVAYRAASTLENALLLADCAATLALVLRRLSMPVHAERRRVEALRGYLALGAKTLRERFDALWAIGDEPTRAD